MIEKLINKITEQNINPHTVILLVLSEAIPSQLLHQWKLWEKKRVLWLNGIESASLEEVLWLCGPAVVEITLKFHLLPQLSKRSWTRSSWVTVFKSSVEIVSLFFKSGEGWDQPELSVENTTLKLMMTGPGGWKSNAQVTDNLPKYTS